MSLNQMQSFPHHQRWYETCGEAFFTQLIIPFLDNPTRDLKSLAETCQFIYHQYSQNCDEWWKSLLKEYHGLTDEELDNQKIKGKFMMFYYQLAYYENHLDQLPKRILFKGALNKKRDARPCFLCASSSGYSYDGLGFINTLVESGCEYQVEKGVYDISLTIDDSLMRISMFSMSLIVVYPSIFENYAKTGIIYSIVIPDNDYDPKNIKPLFKGFTFFYELCKPELPIGYIVTIVIYYRQQDVNDSYKKCLEEEVRKFIKQTYNFKIYLIMECNIVDKDQVDRVVMETVKRYKSIDASLFLKYMIQQAKTKKSCQKM